MDINVGSMAALGHAPRVLPCQQMVTPGDMMEKSKEYGINLIWDGDSSLAWKHPNNQGHLLFSFVFSEPAQELED